MQPDEIVLLMQDTSQSQYAIYPFVYNVSVRFTTALLIKSGLLRTYQKGWSHTHQIACVHQKYFMHSEFHINMCLEQLIRRINEW